MLTKSESLKNKSVGQEIDDLTKNMMEKIGFKGFQIEALLKLDIQITIEGDFLCLKSKKGLEVKIHPSHTLKSIIIEEDGIKINTSNLIGGTL